MLVGLLLFVRLERISQNDVEVLMDIGVFDSGLGGLLVTQSLIQRLPDYSYVYLGDTARVPYGNRSQETIYQFTVQAVDYLFRSGCALVILACNTASAEALRRIQREYLPKYYPDRRVLGVLIPAAEEAIQVTKNNQIGVLGTVSTVASGAFVREIKKLNPDAEVYQQAAPLLVPLLENQGMKWINPIIDEYLASLLAQNIDTLILGCTHYPLVKTVFRGKVGPAIRVICQDEIIPVKLGKYLTRHPETEQRLARTSQRRFFVTDITSTSNSLANQLFGQQTALKKIEL